MDRSTSGGSWLRSCWSFTAFVLAATSVVALAAGGVSHAADPLPGVKSDFKWTPGLPASSQTVTFESTSTVTGIGNSIMRYQWDLDGDEGNGFEKDTGAMPSVSTTYPLPGQVGV